VILREGGSLRKLLLPAVGVLLAVQVGYLASGRWVSKIDFEVGADLPFSLEDGSVEAPSTGCVQAFFINVNCASCNRLAARVATDPNMPQAASPLWLLEEDKETVKNWGSGHGLPPERVLRLTPTRRGQRPTVGRVWFTPTRILLRGESLEVRDVRPSNEVLLPTDLGKLCADGGFAINSFQDGERYLGSTGPSGLSP